MRILLIAILFASCASAYVPKASDNRVITGVKGRYYLVIDGNGRKAPRILSDSIPDASKIGKTLTLKQKFSY